jgi:transcriptional repressor NrdR
MKCPYCRQDDDKVIDSRSSQEGYAIRRRRECLVCGRRWTTYERLEESPLKVVKKDGRRVPFDREKIRQGLARACEKRPISDEQIDELINEVETDVYRNFDREVPSQYIGEQVVQRLQQLDKVAYVRFASVYRDFTDVSDFVEAVGSLGRLRSS